MKRARQKLFENMTLLRSSFLHRNVFRKCRPLLLQVAKNQTIWKLNQINFKISRPFEFIQNDYHQEMNNASVCKQYSTIFQNSNRSKGIIFNRYQ